MYRGLLLSAYLQQLKRASGSRRAELVRAIGAFGEDSGPAAHAVAEALTDSDANIRSAAAWRFRRWELPANRRSPRLKKLLGTEIRACAVCRRWPCVQCTKAVDAVPALVQALSDPEAYVRAPAADAIGNVGPPAKAAVQPLSERLLTAGEQVYVLRSVATALGNIGPDAAGALPALRQALKMPRVTYAAQEAILRIKKEPVPTWF